MFSLAHRFSLSILATLQRVAVTVQVGVIADGSHHLFAEDPGRKVWCKLGYKQVSLLGYSMSVYLYAMAK